MIKNIRRLLLMSIVILWSRAQCAEDQIKCKGVVSSADYNEGPSSVTYSPTHLISLEEERPEAADRVVPKVYLGVSALKKIIFTLVTPHTPVEKDNPFSKKDFPISPVPKHVIGCKHSEI